MTRVGKVDDACRIVRDTKDQEAAEQLIKFFATVNDYQSMIEYALVADMQDVAYQLAKEHQLLDYFALRMGGSVERKMEVARQME